MDLTSAATQLYGVDLADFTSCRTALVASAKAAGDATLARQIGDLRKPVTAAWLVNRLVRAGAEELVQLSELGRALRQAHQDLDGLKLRELSSQRQRLLARLIGRASAGSTVSVGANVQNQLRETFEAAIADAEAEHAVLSGQLTAVLSYSGFGPVDVSDATALGVPVRHLRLVPPSRPADPEERRGDPSRRAPAALPAPAPAPAPKDDARATPAVSVTALARLRRDADQARTKAEAAAAAAADADAAVQLALDESARLRAEVAALTEELDRAERASRDGTEALHAAGELAESKRKAAEQAAEHSQVRASMLAEAEETRSTAKKY